MFKYPEVRLSASNAAVLSSTFALLPVRVRCASKDSVFAFQKVEEVVSALRSSPLVRAGEAQFVSFDEPVAPKLSRADLTQSGKETVVSVTVCLRVKFAPGADYWTRLKFIHQKFDVLAMFGAPFAEDKRLDVYLDAAKLETQKDEPDRHRLFFP